LSSATARESVSNKQKQLFLSVQLLMVTSRIFIFHITDLDIMTDLPEKVGVDAAGNSEQVPLFHQVSEMTGAHFLLHAIVPYC
jgi:hypothetical protein